MCLGVPGKVMNIEQDEHGNRIGTVDFEGIRRRVDLTFTPEARVGDYVIVHVGFAISVVDEEEARAIFSYLREMQELAELEVPEEGA